MLLSVKDTPEKHIVDTPKSCFCLQLKSSVKLETRLFPSHPKQILPALHLLFHLLRHSYNQLLPGENGSGALDTGPRSVQFHCNTVKILSHKSVQLNMQCRRSGSLTVAVSDFALMSARLAWSRCGIRLRCGGIRLHPNVCTPGVVSLRYSTSLWRYPTSP